MIDDGDGRWMMDRWMEGSTRPMDGWNDRHVRLDGRLIGPMDG